MRSWKKWLEKKKVLIADGGLGTELIKQGLNRERFLKHGTSTGPKTSVPWLIPM